MRRMVQGGVGWLLILSIIVSCTTINPTVGHEIKYYGCLDYGKGNHTLTPQDEIDWSRVGQYGKLFTVTGRDYVASYLCVHETEISNLEREAGLTGYAVHYPMVSFDKSVDTRWYSFEWDQGGPQLYDYGSVLWTEECSPAGQPFGVNVYTPTCRFTDTDITVYTIN